MSLAHFRGAATQAVRPMAHVLPAWSWGCAVWAGGPGGVCTPQNRSCRRVWCSVCRAREGGQVQRAQGELHGEEEEEQGEEGHRDGLADALTCWDCLWAAPRWDCWGSSALHGQDAHLRAFWSMPVSQEDRAGDMKPGGRNWCQECGARPGEGRGQCTLGWWSQESKKCNATDLQLA